MMSARYTENRIYAMKSIGLKKFNPLCNLKILEEFAGIGRHWFDPIFDKFRKILKNTLT